MELCCPNSNTTLCIRKEETIIQHLHLALKADTREQVDNFYKVAIKVGGSMQWCAWPSP